MIYSVLLDVNVIRVVVLYCECYGYSINYACYETYTVIMRVVCLEGKKGSIPYIVVHNKDCGPIRL